MSSGEPESAISPTQYSDIRVYPDVGTARYALSMRRSTTTLDRESAQYALETLRHVLGEASVHPHTDTDSNLVIDVDGREIALAIAPMAYATPERVQALEANDRPDGLLFVVADRINTPAKQLIESLGWAYLDASSGELFLHAPGIRINTTVPALTRTDQRPRAGIAGTSGPVLAYEILRRHYDGSTDPIRTTTSREEFGLARSSTSDAMRALEAADLIEPDGSPLVPELFWALARVWQPTDRVWLAVLPDPDDWNQGTEPEAASWHLAGTEAAIAHGAPAVGGDIGPVDLYVPSSTELSIALRRHGAADPISAAASIATPPVHQVVAPGRELPTVTHRGWPVVHPVAAALDLAALDDPRSHQILDEWQPAGNAVWHDH